MVDGFGRAVTYLRLSVTDLCNYRCLYCMPEHGVCKRPHDEMLTVEECVEIVRAAAACGVRKVRITGGEPLVRRGILEICSGVAAVPGIEELCLTTNGSLLEEMAAGLKEAGVTRLNVSLDTLRPDRFRALTRRGSLEDVLRGLQAAEKAGFAGIKLNAVLLGGWNDDEIRDFAELTRQRPWQVRWIELMPLGECADWPGQRFLPASAVLEHCPELEPAGTAGVAEVYRLPGAAGTVGLIRPMSHRFCSRCDRIRVTADGRLKPCLHSAQEIPLKGCGGDELLRRIRRGIAGKPGRHCLEADGCSSAGRNMNEIGG